MLAHQALSQDIVIVYSSGLRTTIDLVEAAVLAGRWKQIDGELIKRVSVVGMIIRLGATILLKPGVLDLVLRGHKE